MRTSSGLILGKKLAHKEFLSFLKKICALVKCFYMRKHISCLLQYFAYKYHFQTIIQAKKKKNIIRTFEQDVFIYKSVSDFNVTIVKPRDMNFMGKITYIWLNFVIVRFAHTKKCSLYFLCFLLCFLLKYKEIKGKVFGVCKTKHKQV